MNLCPNEVLIYIFELACDDDGSTGRAINLISRRFHNLAQECMYQTIAVVGLGRIKQLATILEGLPESKRRVRHVFLSTVAQNSDEIVQNYQKTSEIFTQLFRLVARTLVSCRMISHFPRPARLLPISCPRLRELTLEGPFPTLPLIHDTIPYFPLLRTLRFTCFSDYPNCLFDEIVTMAPHLTSISFIPSEPCRNLCEDLGRALAIPTLPRTSSEYVLPRIVCKSTSLPALQEVAVQPGQAVVPEGRNAHCLRSVQELMKKQLLYLQKHDKHRRVRYVAPATVTPAPESLLSWLRER